MNTANINAYIGDDFTLAIQYQDADGDAEDITGFVFYFSGKQNISDTSLAFEKTVSSHTNAVAGITSITIARAATILLSGAYYYDLKYKDADDKVHTAATGTIVFQKNIKGAIA